jgi:hypothetical protein
LHESQTLEVCGEKTSGGYIGFALNEPQAHKPTLLLGLLVWVVNKPITYSEAADFLYIFSSLIFEK